MMRSSTRSNDNPATPIQGPAAAVRARTPPSRAAKDANKEAAGRTKTTATATTRSTATQPPTVPAKKKKAITTTKKKTTKKAKQEAAGIGPNKRPPNFTSEEDLFLCKAYVNVSTDPTVGTGQKGATFWDRVQEKFTSIVEEESEVKVLCATRDSQSLMNRWQRHIMRHVNKFNKYYKQHKTPPKSGWNEEQYIKAASDRYLEMEGKQFKWSHCMETLHQMPRFNPMMAHHEAPEEDDDADGTAKRTFNEMGGAMGDSSERPIGSKAAKKKIRDQASDLSLESSKVASMQQLSASTEKLSSVLETKAKHDMWMKQAMAYISLGQTEKGQQFLEKIEADQKKIEEAEATKEAAALLSPQVPIASVTVTNKNIATTEAEQASSRSSTEKTAENLLQRYKTIGLPDIGLPDHEAGQEHVNDDITTTSSGAKVMRSKLDDDDDEDDVNVETDTSESATSGVDPAVGV